LVSNKVGRLLLATFLSFSLGSCASETGREGLAARSDIEKLVYLLISNEVEYISHHGIPCGESKGGPIEERKPKVCYLGYEVKRLSSKHDKYYASLSFGVAYVQDTRKIRTTASFEMPKDLTLPANSIIAYHLDFWGSHGDWKPHYMQLECGRLTTDGGHRRGSQNGSLFKEEERLRRFIQEFNRNQI